MEDKVQRGSTSLAVKSGMWYVVGTFITKGLAFLTTPIFARLMSPSDYGEFTNFANWQSLLLIVVSAELYNTLSRAFYDYQEDYDQYSSTVTILGFVLNIFFYVFFLINRNWIFEIVAIPERYVHLMFFAMMMQGCRQVYQVKERTLYKYKAAAAISVLSLVIPTVISIVVVMIVPQSNRLDARMYGFYIPYALIGVYCVFVLLRKKFAFRLKYCKYAFVLALPLLVHYLTTYLLASTNTIITKSCLGAETAAMVSIDVAIMNVLIMLFQSISGALTTWMMDKLQENEIGSIKNCINLYTVGAAVICVAVMVLGPEIVLVIGGAQYKEAVTLLPGFMLSVFLQIISTVFTIILTYRKKVAGTAITTAVIAVLSIIAKIYFLPQFGVEILPFINVISFGIVLVVNYFWIYRFGDGRFFQLLFVLPVILFVVILCLICPYLYNNNVIRYIICGLGIAALVIVLVITRKKWMKYVSKILRVRNNKKQAVVKTHNP